MPKLATPRSKPRRHTAALIAYDGMPAFEYAIAVEVFVLVRPNLGVDWYRTQIVAAHPGKITSLGGIVIEPDGGIERLSRADTIVIPGWDINRPQAPPALLQALQRAARRGARLLSICTGAFLLAEAGLLAGRRATTHWVHAAAFKERYPEVEFADDVLYVDQGNLITSAGSGAGIDACLHLVRRDFGPQVANMVARRMVVAPHREGGQAQYVETPVAARPGRSISGALDWARRRLDQPLTIADLSARVPMSSRSFLRHFRGTVGMPPLEWLQRERIARARSLLESTPLPLASVAAQCGFQSSETFRATFKRIVGVAPGAYRQRFSVAG